MAKRVLKMATSSNIPWKDRISRKDCVLSCKLGWSYPLTQDERSIGCVLLDGPKTLEELLLIGNQSTIDSMLEDNFVIWHKGRYKLNKGLIRRYR